MISVRVGTTYLDLYPNIEDSFYITRQQRDLRDWNQRNSDFTRALEVPRTATNNLTLLPHIESGVKAIPGSIEVDGISIDQSLSFIVNNIPNEDSFTLDIVMDSQKLFTNIQGNIKDLDFDDLEFTWNQAGVDAIKDTTDIVYALALWTDLEGYQQVKNEGGLQWFTDQCIYATGFFIYAKELLDRIVQSAGMTLDVSNVTANDLFNNTAIPCPIGKKFIDPDLTTVQKEVVSSASNEEYTTSGQKIKFDTVDVAGSSYWDNVTDTEFDFTLDTNIILSGYLSVTILGLVVGSDYSQPAISLVRNSTIIRQWILDPNRTNFTISIHEELYVNNGDEVALRCHWGKFNNAGIRITAGAWLKVSSLNQDTTISINNHLPDVSKADFVKGILNHTNLIFSLEDNVMVLYDFDIIYQNFYEAEIVENQPQPQTFSFSNLFKLSILKYKEPPEPLLRTDTSFKFRVNDESLDDEGVIMELPFEDSDIIDATINGSTQLALLDTYEYEVNSFSIVTGTAAQSTFTISPAQPFGPLNYIIGVTNTQIRRIATRTSAGTGTISGTWAVNLAGVSYHFLKIKAKRKPLKLVYIDDADGNFDIFTDTNAATTTIANGKKATFGENMLLGSIAGNQYNNIIETMRFPKVLEVWIRIPGYEMFPKSLLRKVVYVSKYSERYYINKLSQWKSSTGQALAELVRLR